MGHASCHNIAASRVDAVISILFHRPGKSKQQRCYFFGPSRSSWPEYIVRYSRYLRGLVSGFSHNFCGVHNPLQVQHRTAAAFTASRPRLALRMLFAVRTTSARAARIAASATFGQVSAYLCKTLRARVLSSESFPNNKNISSSANHSLALVQCTVRADVHVRLLRSVRRSDNNLHVSPLCAGTFSASLETLEKHELESTLHARNAVSPCLKKCDHRRQ